MGYVIVEYLTYLALVAALGALLFGVSATYLVAKEGTTLIARTAARYWHAVGVVLTRTAAESRALLHHLNPHSR